MVPMVQYIKRLSNGHESKALTAMERDRRQDQVTQSQWEGRHIRMRLTLLAPLRQNQNYDIHRTHSRAAHSMTP